MERKNCWEVMNCGRQPGGWRVEELGVCPAAKPTDFDGANKGTYNGRFCWAVAGTFCSGDVQGTFEQKLRSCLDCKFFNRVYDEEGKNFLFSP